ICLSVLVTLELGTRTWNRLRQGRWTVNDPEKTAANSGMYLPNYWVGQIPRPNTDVDSFGRHIHINSLGFRGPEILSTRPPHMHRMACIGGSTTFDIKVSQDALAWPAQLGAILRQSHGVNNVEVINAATCGYSLPRSIIDLMVRTLDIEPDWVICYP